MATDYLFTSNTYGSGAKGVRITLGTKTVGPTANVPCSSAVQQVNWSPNGASWGVHRNRDFDSSNDYIWVSVSSNSANDCGAASGYCLGMDWYKVGSVPSGDNVTGSDFTAAWNEATTAVVPDGIGNSPDVAALDKRSSGSIEEWDVSSASAWSVGSNSQLSQMEWVGTTDLYAYTAANTTVQGGSCNCGSNGCGTDGKIGLGKYGATGAVSSVTVPRATGREHWSTKPEGVSVTPIRAGNSATCTSGATDVVYVTDYCASQLLVYTVDDTAGTPTLTFEATLDLDASSGLTGECHPSSVQYEPASNKTYVTCQARNSIIKINTGTDQCNPTWNSEAALQYYSAGGNPSCANTPTLQTCTNCQPHDIAFDHYSAPGWLFTTLVPGGAGQVLAIKDDSLSNQFLVYRDAGGTYKPVALDLLPAQPPE